MSNDSLGDRMKQLEARETERDFFRYIPVYARIDGRGFSKFTRKMTRPFDPILSEIMIKTTMKLVAETEARIGYTQSDEISLVWLVDNYRETMMFRGRVQKMTSILASMTTAFFTPLANACWPNLVERLPPVFDCRVFQVPNQEEAANAILWRELDATKNAVSMACRHYYSHKMMHKKSGSEMQEMLFQKGINFNDYPASFKRGTFVQRQPKIITSSQTDQPVQRRTVKVIEMPSFRTVVNRADVIFRGDAPKTMGVDHVDGKSQS